MNVSQANLYEILDAFQIHAMVGEGVFDIKNGIKLNNGTVKANVNVTGLHLKETETSMYAVMSIGDLIIIAKAKNGSMDRVTLVDARYPVVDGYLGIKDYTALLIHLSHEQWKCDFVIGDKMC